MSRARQVIIESIKDEMEVLIAQRRMHKRLGGDSLVSLSISISFDQRIETLRDTLANYT